MSSASDREWTCVQLIPWPPRGFSPGPQWEIRPNAPVNLAPPWSPGSDNLLFLQAWINPPPPRGQPLGASASTCLFSRCHLVSGWEISGPLESCPSISSFAFLGCEVPVLSEALDLIIVDPKHTLLSRDIMYAINNDQQSDIIHITE